MKINLKNLNLKQQMIFTIIPVLLIIFIILGSSVYLYVKDVLEAESINEAKSIAHDFASQMETELAMYLDIQHQFNYLFAQYEKMPINSRRKFYSDLTLNLLEKNEKLLAT
jgi:hypothetical protein